MAGTSANRIGGQALLIGGILFTIALVLHPDVSTLERASAAGPGQWAFVHWAYLVGDVLLIGGLVTLFRHLAAGGTGSGGWAGVALAGGMTGFVLDAAATGIHLTAFPPAIPPSTPNLQNIFDAATAVNTGIGNAGYLAASLGLLIFGWVLKREGWSPAASVGVMAVGGLEILLAVLAALTGSTLIPAGTATLAVNALMPVAYAVVGVSFSKGAAQ